MYISYIIIALLIVACIYLIKKTNQLKIQNLFFQNEIEKVKSLNIKHNEEISLNNKKILELIESNKIKDDKINELKNTFQEEIHSLKNTFFEEKKYEFNEGIKKGIEQSQFSVEIYPFQEIEKKKGLFNNEEFVNIGNKYLYNINGFNFASHVEIFEKISRKEIDEIKVNNILGRISEIANKIPNPNIQLVGSLSEFGKSLLNLNKK